MSNPFDAAEAIRHMSNIEIAVHAGNGMSKILGRGIRGVTGASVIEIYCMALMLEPIYGTPAPEPSSEPPVQTAETPAPTFQGATDL